MEERFLRSGRRNMRQVARLLPQSRQIGKWWASYEGNIGLASAALNILCRFFTLCFLQIERARRIDIALACRQAFERGSRWYSRNARKWTFNDAAIPDNLRL